MCLYAIGLPLNFKCVVNDSLKFADLKITHLEEGFCVTRRNVAAVTFDGNAGSRRVIPAGYFRLIAH
jgi:hypothetical protein